MINIYFVRHFPTSSNTSNCWCGSGSNIDIDNKKSIECLNKLNKIMTINFDYIFISPLKRCYQTFSLLNLKAEPIIDERIIERDFGLLDQKPCIDSDKDQMGDFDLNTDLGKNVEKIQDMYFKRILPFINDLKKLPNNSNVLIISHSWIGRLLKYYFSNNKDEIKVAPKNGQLLEFVLK